MPSVVEEEAVALLAHEAKNVRAGAGKILEQVAVSRPDLAAHLEHQSKTVQRMARKVQRRLQEGRDERQTA